MNITWLQSPLLAPARLVWRVLRRYEPVRVYVERRLLYPRIPHVELADKSKMIEEPPTLLAGFFTSVHGIGEAARLELQAMRDAGHTVCGVDIGPAFGLNDMASPEGVVPLHEAPVNGPLLLHCNAPEMGRALQYLGKKLTAGRPIIGYWAWELEAPPRDWEKAYAYLNELWVPSHHTAKAFADATFPVKVHPHPVIAVLDAGHTLEDLGLGECRGKTLFLCMADGRSDLVRKNIRGTVRAFGRALGTAKGAALVVKLHHSTASGDEIRLLRQECAAWSNVHVVERVFSTKERNSLLHRCHAVLSLHRSEGFGLLCAEALALKKTIIATAYGGVLDFLHAGNSILLSYRRVPVRGDILNYADYAESFWAEVEEEVAVASMMQVAVTSGQHGERA